MIQIQGQGNGARGNERGTGARDTRRARVLGKIDERNALKLKELAQQLARARARKVEAWEGRAVSASTQSEMEGIYHAALIPAFLKTGTVIDLQRLFLRFKRKGINPYSFSVRRAWVKAIYGASREAIAECYQAHKVHDLTVSMHDLVELKEVLEGNWGEIKAVEVVESEALATGTGKDSGARAVRAREVRHAKDCLRVFWALSGSKRWRHALASDLSLLARCVVVARGGAFQELGELGENGGFRTSAARKSIERLLQRISAGDVLMTERPTEADAITGTGPAKALELSPGGFRSPELSELVTRARGELASLSLSF